MLKNDPHVFTGMRRDTSISKQQPQYLYDARNIRFTAKTGNTLMSMTNEKGPRKETTFAGYYLGHCVINNYLVVFTKNISTGEDNIYRRNIEDGKTLLLYRGNLGFDVNYPIDTLGYYELENLQKVYWIDGKNQPRVINIKKPELLDLVETDGPNKGLYKQNKSFRDAFPTDNSFDFIKNLQLKETIEVSKGVASGLFPSGVIQYCITYSNLYDSETNIAETSPLYSITFADRGGNGEESIPTSFKIKVNNVDKNFEYLHVYSILRTSLNGTPQVKLVDKIYIKNLAEGENSIELIDSNTGSIVDSNYLLYVGGEDIRPNCFAQKDNTAFFGNYVEYRKSIKASLGEAFSSLSISTYDEEQEDFPKGTIINTPEVAANSKISLSTAYRGMNLIGDGNQVGSISEYINYMQSSAVEGSLLNYSFTKDNIGHILSPTNYLRGNEFYRLGLQFQHITGKWSEPVWIGDVKTSDAHPVLINAVTGEDTNLQVATLSVPELVASLSLDTPLRTALSANKYVKVRSIVTFPNEAESNILCQGILAPTVYSESAREEGTPTNQSSWFIRPFVSNTAFSNSNSSDPVLTRTGDSLDSGTDEPTEGPTEEPTIEPTVDPSVTDTPIIPETPYSAKSKDMFSYTINNGGSYNSSIFNDLTDAFKVLDFKAIELTERTAQQGGSSITDYFNNEFFVGAGSNVKFEHGSALDTMLQKSGELEYSPVSSWNEDTTHKIYYKPLTGGEKYFQMSKKSAYGLFHVDQSVLTLHSPDVLYNDNFSLIKWGADNYNINIVGKAYYSMNIGGINLQTSSPAAVSKGGGFKKIKTVSSGQNGSRGLCAALVYEDTLMDTIDEKGSYPYDYKSGAGSRTANDTVLYMVYPWQKSGSLNNDKKREDGSAQSAVLSKKCIYNFKFSPRTKFSVNNNPFGNNSDEHYTYTKPLIGLQYFGSDQMALVRMDNGTSYYGNIDTVIPTTLGIGKLFTLGYKANIPNDNSRIGASAGILEPLQSLSNLSYLGAELFDSSSIDANSSSGWIQINNTPNVSPGVPRLSSNVITGAPGDKDKNLRFNKGNIRMKYKSTPHLVVSLGDDNYLRFQYKPNMVNNVNTELTYGFSYLAELYRNINPNTYSSLPLFGGTSSEALQANNWIVTGKSVSLLNENNEYKTTPVDIRYSYGDTWYQRFDCLKTYPFTFEDENQIIEIASFMVETKTNLDGRYDRNKNPVENFNLSPANFGLLNKVYSQRDNFFNYRILPDIYYNEQKFPSTFFWTKEKVAGEEVDSWTNINLANQWLMDGTYGKLNSIIAWNNRLFAFQDRAISAISFNPRVEIATTDGVPVEIANSKKLEGVVTIDNNRGCINKWEIAPTESGVYFRDSISKDLCHIGSNVTSIGSLHGFDYWFKNQASAPFDVFLTGRGNKLFADAYYKDLYYVNPEEALVFSEVLGEFTSFMSYGGMIALFNCNNATYSIKSSRNSSYQSNATVLYKMFKGEYNKYFFDSDPSVPASYEPFSFSFISNAESAIDKTFSTVEVQADFYKDDFDPTPTIGPGPTEVPGTISKNPINNEYIKTWGFFNKFRIQTEYQDSWGPLANPTQPPFNIKNHTYITPDLDTILDNVRKGSIAKKFRTWRVSVPRDANSKYSRDRIRNQWCKIQFGLDNPENTKMELHNINVQYFT